MSSRLTIEQLAAALELKPRQVSNLVKQGMPRDDVEAARKWRADRLVVIDAPAGIELETLDDGTLASTIQRHRQLVAKAQGIWHGAMEGGDSNQGKYQTAYNQSLKTLMALEEEQKKRAIDSREFIKRSEAEATVREIVGEILSTLDKVGLECAEKANPDNPALASKVLDAWARSARERLSRE